MRTPQGCVSFNVHWRAVSACMHCKVTPFSCWRGVLCLHGSTAHDDHLFPGTDQVGVRMATCRAGSTLVMPAPTRLHMLNK